MARASFLLQQMRDLSSGLCWWKKDSARGVGDGTMCMCVYLRAVLAYVTFDIKRENLKMTWAAPCSIMSLKFIIFLRWRHLPCILFKATIRSYITISCSPVYGLRLGRGRKRGGGGKPYMLFIYTTAFDDLPRVYSYVVRTIGTIHSQLLDLCFFITLIRRESCD